MIYLGLSYTFPDPAGITNARCPGVQVSRLQQEETKHLQAVQANQRLEKDMAVGNAWDKCLLKWSISLSIFDHFSLHGCMKHVGCIPLRLDPKFSDILHEAAVLQ